MPVQTIRAEMAKVRREVAIVGAVIAAVAVLAILITGWFGDHRSCIRQVDIRRALIEQRKLNREAIPYWEAQGMLEVADRLRKRVKADSHIQQLDCSRLLPGT